MRQKFAKHYIHGVR